MHVGAKVQNDEQAPIVDRYLSLDPGKLFVCGGSMSIRSSSHGRIEKKSHRRLLSQQQVKHWYYDFLSIISKLSHLTGSWRLTVHPFVRQKVALNQFPKSQYRLRESNE